MKAKALAAGAALLLAAGGAFLYKSRQATGTLSEVERAAPALPAGTEPEPAPCGPPLPTTTPKAKPAEPECAKTPVANPVTDPFAPAVPPTPDPFAK